jgi:hypothetical protein
MRLDKRIAIFTQNDYTWAFPTWVRTIPELVKGYDVVGIFLFPEQMGKLKGVRIPFWYLRVFGPYNFLLLALYATKIRLWRFTSQIRTWKQLASKYGIDLKRGETPNAQVVRDWVKENNIDIIFVTVGNILKADLIDAPKIGIINKHASILPSCRGLFSYFWAAITASPTGITFHQVDSGIDTGNILVQMRYPPPKSERVSMLRFYIDIFSFFPVMAPLAAKRLIDKDHRGPISDVSPSYFGLPTRKEFQQFQKEKCRVATLSDLFYRPRSIGEELSKI